MKLLFTTIALFLITLAHAGEFTSTILTKGEDGSLMYEKVVKAENQTKEVLYKRLKLWVIANVKTTDVNVLFDDEKFETIITTPTIQLKDLRWRHLHDQKVSFKLQLNFKDNKMKITTSGFNYYAIELSGRLHTGEALQMVNFKGFTPSPYPKVSENFDEAFSAFINTLEKAATSEKTNDNW